MVAQWSLDTEALADVVAEDARRLRELAASPPAIIGPDYLQTLAFDLPHYRPTAENLTAIAAALDGGLRGPELRVRPRRSFRRSAAPEVVTIREVPPPLEMLI